MRTKVKKLTSVILTVVMMLGILTIAPLTVSAATEGSYGDFDYTIENNSTCTIDRYWGTSSSVTIPSKIYGYSVTKIGDTAFWNNTTLKSVNIPDSVTIVNGFSGCSNLNYVKFPLKLKTIEYGAFEGTAIQTVNLPVGTEELGGYCFEECKNLTSVSLPNSVKKVEYDAFKGCTKLFDISIQAKEIEDGVFEGCTNLTSVTIADRVIKLGDSSFKNCTKLKNVNIGSGLEYIGDNGSWCTFDGCSVLESITVNSANKNFSSADGVMYNKNKSEVIIYPQGKKNTEWKISGTIDYLSSESTGNNPYLKTVVVPKDTVLFDHSVGYIRNGDAFKKVSGFTVKGYKNSDAETYAKENGFNFVVINNSLPTPKITSLANTTGGIKISWNKVDGAYGYRLYYKPASGGWKRFKDTTATSFTDSGVSPNRTETYTIRCIDKNGNTVSSFNSNGWSKKYTPAAPTISKLENTSGGIKISWNKIAGVYGYRLYYKTSSGGWKRFKDTTATSFTDSGVSPNRTETYTIRCIDKNGNTVSGFYSKGWSMTYTPVAPTITRLSNTSKGVSVTWNKIAGVYGYRLYRKYDGGSWTRVKDTTSTSFTDSGAKKGKKVTYTVRCIDRKGKTVSGFNSKGWSITRK